MKKWILLIIALVLSVSAILWMKGNAMREIRTEIEISAPTEKVWQVLANVENWPNWNPIVVQASGVPAIGATLTITMRGEDGKNGPKYMPVVTSFQEASSFEWRAKMISEFMFTNGRVFKLEKTNSGTRLTNTETFKGMLVPLFWSKLSHHVPIMLAEMNVALKKSVEQKTEK